MQSQGYTRDAYTYSTVISSCELAGDWVLAFDILERMKNDTSYYHSESFTSAVPYNAALTVCVK